MSPPYHHGNLRAAALDRAWEIADAEGIDALSLRALARDCGVSHGALSRHFADKGALLDALSILGFQRLNAALTTASGREDEPRARLAAAAHAYVEFALAHPSVLREMYAAKLRPGSSDDLKEVSHRAMSELIESLETARDDGLIDTDDPVQLAQVAFAAVHGIAMLAVDDLLDQTPHQQLVDRAMLSLLASPAH